MNSVHFRSPDCAVSSQSYRPVLFYSAKAPNDENVRPWRERRCSWFTAAVEQTLTIDFSNSVDLIERVFDLGQDNGVV
jgi:hypothetical protein